MSIDTICQGCARKLRVGDEFAGKKARCPDCKTVYVVPAKSESSHEGREETPASSVSPERWMLRTETGDEYGPVAKYVLDAWLSQGRITSRCFLRREDSSSYQPAAAIYSSLQGSSPSPVQRNPFADRPEQEDHPYAAPQAGSQSMKLGGHVTPHRGGVVLALGICALVFNVCLVPGIMAWYMGSSDLKAMNRGDMDLEGHSLTQVGMILGIAGTVLNILCCSPFILPVIFN